MRTQAWYVWVWRASALHTCMGHADGACGAVDNAIAQGSRCSAAAMIGRGCPGLCTRACVCFACACVRQIVVGAVGIGFVYPLFYGAWKKMETGLEMPMGFFISVMGAFAVWSGMWALVGDDTYLALAPLVCVACIAIVRNCTRVKPPDFVYKGDSLVSAGFSVERQPTGGGV